ncbi:MAG: hypothetical protein ACRYG2_28865 [Janthinobacterium lividum]
MGRRRFGPAQLGVSRIGSTVIGVGDAGSASVATSTCSRARRPDQEPSGLGPRRLDAVRQLERPRVHASTRPRVRRAAGVAHGQRDRCARTALDLELLPRLLRHRGLLLLPAQRFGNGSVLLPARR